MRAMRVIVAVLAAALLAGGVVPTAAAAVPDGHPSLAHQTIAVVPRPAQPAPPDPPPSPATTEKAAQVGALVGRLSALQAQLDAASDRAGRREEVANRAFADDTAARGRADESRRAAAAAQARADAANVAVEQARDRVDAWATAWFQQADMTSPTAVLAGATGPDEILDRATLRDAVTGDQVAALDALDRARRAAADAQARARAGRVDADRAAATAATAATGARDELVRARAGVDEQMRAVRGVSAERDAARASLQALEASDAAIAAQRRRAEALAADADARASASDTDTRSAARTRLAAAGGDPARIVVDRALSQLGTVYAWGGGDADGPTRGVRDGGVADAFGDFAKVGFDCSGLMMYAFAAVGKQLPHYSGYQATAGRQVPLEQRRPGDMLFWADGADVHHVALYVGDDRMVEAPESGKVVRVVPVRFDDGILPTVTRLL